MSENLSMEGAAPTSASEPVTSSAIFSFIKILNYNPCNIYIYIYMSLAIVLLILFGIIITILCCRSCKNRKQAYRPGIERRSDALLSSSPSR
uniref:E3 CR1-beta n=1 Tax=Heterorhabditis bacteriophora TaxID=37862 RepID=A0A1I7WZV4_HETBA